MTDANTKPEISALVTNIRVWEAADLAFTKAKVAWFTAPDIKEVLDELWIARCDAGDALAKAALQPHDPFTVVGEKTLAQFVALADAHEAATARCVRLEAENLKLWQAYNTLFTCVWMIGDYDLTDNTNLREHAEATIDLARHTVRLVDAIGLEDAKLAEPTQADSSAQAREGSGV
jgi:hypothetical protein